MASASVLAVLDLALAASVVASVAKEAEAAVTAEKMKPGVRPRVMMASRLATLAEARWRRALPELRAAVCPTGALPPVSSCMETSCPTLLRTVTCLLSPGLTPSCLDNKVLHLNRVSNLTKHLLLRPAWDYTR